MEEPSTLQGRKKCPKVSSKNPKRSCWFLATCWIIPLASLSLLGQTFSEILLFLFLCVSFYFFLFFFFFFVLFLMPVAVLCEKRYQRSTTSNDVDRVIRRRFSRINARRPVSNSHHFVYYYFFFHYFTVVSLISLPPYWASIVWIRFEALPVSSIRFNLISLLQCSTSSHSLSTGLEVPCLVIISQSES